MPSETDIAKVCSDCKTEKPLTDYYERASRCKPCHANTMREWRKQNRERYLSHKRNYYSQPVIKKRQRDQFLQRAYGITLTEYNELFAKQNGCCAICGKHQSELNKSLAVDHNHKTKKIRGLLCQFCNRAIGLLFDDQSLLKKIIKYLGANNAK